MPVSPRSSKTPKGRNSSLLTTAIKYGPLIAEGVRRYGPTVRDQVLQNKDVIGDMVSGASSRPRRGEARRNALAHAGSVVDGSAMQCFHKAREYWVVFSGETPIGVHPFTEVPYGELLRHADLSKRVRPADGAGRGVLGRVAGAVRSPQRATRPQPQRYRPTPQEPPATGRTYAGESEPVEGEII